MKKNRKTTNSKSNFKNVPHNCIPVNCIAHCNLIVNYVICNYFTTILYVFSYDRPIFRSSDLRPISDQRSDQDRTAFDMVVSSSFHHIIISSYHHIIISSYDHIMISSYHHINITPPSQEQNFEISLATFWRIQPIVPGFVRIIIRFAQILGRSAEFAKKWHVFFL